MFTIWRARPDSLGAFGLQSQHLHLATLGMNEARINWIHILIFSLPEYSVLCVKSLLGSNNIFVGTISQLVVLLFQDVAWSAHDSSLLMLFWCSAACDTLKHEFQSHWTHTHTLSILQALTFLPKGKKRFPREGFHCLPIILQRKDWSAGRGTCAKQMKMCSGWALVRWQLQEN